MSVETWIAAAALLVSFAGRAAYIWFERRKRGREAARQASTRRGHAVAGDRNVIIGSVSLHSPPPLTQPPRPTRPPPARAVKKSNEDNEPEEEEGEACDPGPYEVEPGEMVEIPLDLEPGETLTGNLDADGAFSFEIVNERNLVLARRREEFTPIRTGDDETSYSVRWKAKGKGPWFLRLSAPRKQFVREVHVNFRKRG